MTTRSKQFSLFPEGFHQGGTAAHPPQRLARGPSQLGEILRAEIGQFVLLAVSPDVFDRIQFRRIGRQTLQMDAVVLLSDVIPDQAAAVKDKRVCGMPEDEDLWAIGRGFIVRDLPWSEEKLRAIPPFEFENWAVIALGGRKNKVQVGDKGIDGRIFPASALDNVREAGADELALEVSTPCKSNKKTKQDGPILTRLKPPCAGPNAKKVFS